MLLTALFVNVRFSVEKKGCLHAVAVSVVERRRDKRQLVEEERIKQGFVCLAKGGLILSCPTALSHGLRFLDWSLMEARRLSSDFYIYLF